MAALYAVRTLLSCCLVGLLGTADPAAAQAAPGAPTLRVCVGDGAVPPFLGGDAQHLGVSERLMLDAGAKLGLKVELLRWPARRCIEQMRLGQVEASIGAPIAANLAEFDFPGASPPDPQLRIARVAIMLVKRRDGRVSWDGQQLDGGGGQPLRIGARAGFRAGEDALRRAGQTLHITPIQTTQALRMLQLGRLDLVVAAREEANAQLQRPEFAELQLLEPPLAVSDFYIMSIRTLPEPLGSLVSRWWALMAQWRDLPAYQANGSSH